MTAQELIAAARLKYARLLRDELGVEEGDFYGADYREIDAIDARRLWEQERDEWLDQQCAEDLKEHPDRDALSRQMFRFDLACQFRFWKVLTDMSIPNCR